MNAQVAIGTALKNPGQVKKIKKTIAKILSVKQEKAGKLKSKNSEVDKKA